MSTDDNCRITWNRDDEACTEEGDASLRHAAAPEFSAAMPQAALTTLIAAA